MAGFRDHGTGPVALRAVPHPAVTLVLQFGDGWLVVDDTSGCRQRGSLVAGLPAGGIRTRGEGIECVEVRLSPVAARAVLGVCPAEPDRTVVALDDLWGRDAARIRERLGAASSWEERFALTDALLTRIGQALAARLAARGGEMVLTGRRGDLLEAMAGKLGGRAVPADLADRDAIEEPAGRGGPDRRARGQRGAAPQALSPGLCHRRQARIGPCAAVGDPPRLPAPNGAVGRSGTRCNKACASRDAR